MCAINVLKMSFNVCVACTLQEKTFFDLQICYSHQFYIFFLFTVHLIISLRKLWEFICIFAIYLFFG
jgi:hypothetical protein